MANVLEKIVEDKKQELVELKAKLPLSDFQDKLSNSTNSFFDALAADGTSYIFECKKASPSKGLIRENFDLDEITQAYAKEAACFSVLTDNKYFQGKHEYLPYVTQKVKQPTLNKDFFVDEYQIHLARHLQANAVLLMLSVLDDEQYQALAALTHSYDMDVLTEVSNEEETARALALGAKIIGINNRDLRDLSTNLATTEKLVPLIRKDKSFKGVIISESGIYTNQDIHRLSPLVDGFLVGSALMAKPNLDLAVSQLVYGKVKVCGVTSLEQAQMISSFPVSYLGLIFAPNSSRFVCVESALEITQNVSAQFVGVFVDQPLEMVADYARKLKLSAVQLHGSESEQYMRDLKQVLDANCEVWKALPVALYQASSIHKDIEQYSHIIADKVLSKVLLDCKVGTQSGGTGQAFDWRLLDNIKDKSTLVLAGGVSGQNIQAASKIGVDIIDTNSGLESAPGVKSSELLKALFSQLRA